MRNPMILFLAKIWRSAKAYLGNKEETYNRIIHFARLSILINAAIGLGKILMGLSSPSPVFVFSGLYNVGISLAKAVAVRGYAESKGKKIWPFPPDGTAHPAEKALHLDYRYYRSVGVIVLLASAAYIIGSSYVIIRQQNKAYFSTIAVVGIGVITVVEIITAKFLQSS